MATPTTVIALTQLAAPSDTQTEIRNAIDAREGVQALIATLESQRKDAGNLFLRTFAADLAAVKGSSDKSFVDAQFAKFNTWKTADEEIAKRIAALQTIADGLKRRIDEFKAANRDQVIALLRQQIQVLEELQEKQDAEEEILNQRLEALKSELDQLASETSAKTAAPARKGKN
jgi:hypothetical protein